MLTKWKYSCLTDCNYSSNLVRTLRLGCRYTCFSFGNSVFDWKTSLHQTGDSSEQRCSSQQELVRPSCPDRSNLHSGMVHFLQQKEVVWYAVIPFTFKYFWHTKQFEVTVFPVVRPILICLTVGSRLQLPSLFRSRMSGSSSTSAPTRLMRLDLWAWWFHFLLSSLTHITSLNLRRRRLYSGCLLLVIKLLARVAASVIAHVLCWSVCPTIGCSCNKGFEIVDRHKLPKVRIVMSARRLPPFPEVFNSIFHFRSSGN